MSRLKAGLLRQYPTKLKAVLSGPQENDNPTVGLALKLFFQDSKHTAPRAVVYRTPHLTRSTNISLSYSEAIASNRRRSAEAITTKRLERDTLYAYHPFE